MVAFGRSSLAVLSIFQSSSTTTTASVAFAIAGRTRRGALLSCLSTNTTGAILFAIGRLSSAIGTSTTSSCPATRAAAAAAAAATTTKTSLFSSSSSSYSSSIMETGYLNAQDAASLDVELMSSPGFSLEQLMELAGLSVAEAVYTIAMEKKKENNNEEPPSSGKGILVVCGPGEPREPFKTTLDLIQKAQEEKEGVATTVISVDVPSGWNVDEGDINDTGFVPDVLISLTTPKNCSKIYKGRHFVGGRFLPPKLAEKYGVRVRVEKAILSLGCFQNLDGKGGK